MTAAVFFPAVIYMEGGSDKDLEALEADEAEAAAAVGTKEDKQLAAGAAATGGGGKKKKHSKKSRKKSEASGSSRESSPNKVSVACRRHLMIQSVFVHASRKWVPDKSAQNTKTKVPQ